MKFYIDFEATQYTENIISIGCVAENGDSFSSLVNCPYKVGSFVTQLTGITNDMVSTAPSPDEVFTNFFKWIMERSEGVPSYYCYGNADSGYIRNTVKNMKDFSAITFALSIAGNLIDYSRDVCNFFNMKQVGLHRVFLLMQEEAGEQKHDALEDAQMLAFVEQNMAVKCKPEDKAVMPAATHPNTKKAPAKFLAFPDGRNNKYLTDTGADENNYMYKYQSKNNSDGVKYFDSLETAYLWAMKYCLQGKSPKKDKDIKMVQKNINNAIKNDVYYGGGKWTLNENYVEKVSD